MACACSVYEPELVGKSGDGEGGSGASTGATAGKQAGMAGTEASGGGGATAGQGGSGGSGGSEPAPVEPYLRGDLDVSPNTVVLSNEGGIDWVHWGLKGPADSNRKAEVTPQLLDFEAYGATSQVAYTGGLVAYSWNDGTPTVAATTHAGIAWEGEGEGVELTLRAAAEERVLRLYAGVKGGTARFSAALSEAGVAPFAENFMSDDEAWVLRRVTLDYGLVEAANATLAITLSVETGSEAAVSLAALSIDAK